MEIYALDMTLQVFPTIKLICLFLSKCNLYNALHIWKNKDKVSKVIHRLFILHYILRLFHKISCYLHFLMHRQNRLPSHVLQLRGLKCLQCCRLSYLSLHPLCLCLLVLLNSLKQYYRDLQRACCRNLGFHGHPLM